MNVRGGLHMGGDHICARLRKGLDVAVHRRNHEVDIHHAFDVWADGSAGSRAKGDVGHEMPVHHIHVDPVRALPLNCGTFCAEIGKVCGKD